MIAMRRLLVPLMLLCLAALVSGTYWAGLRGDFLFDDYPNIVSNPKVQPQTLDWDAVKRAVGGYDAGTIGRPLATLSFAVNYAVDGKSPYGYKVVNLVVHLLNALLVFWLVLRLIRLPALADRRWAAWAALGITLAWAVHPLQVSTVLYVVQRMEMLALTFVLLALVAYLRGRTAQMDGRRGWPWLVLSGLLAIGGLSGKESAVLFPLYTLALELTVLGFAATEARTRRFLQTAYALVVLAGVVVFAFVIVPMYAADGAYAMRDYTMVERLLTQPRVLVMHLGQILLPNPAWMTFYYDAYPKSTGWLHPATTLASALLLVVLLAGALALRKRAPLAALGVLWFFAAHALTSNIINLEMVFEHRNYFALLGVVLVLADAIGRIREPDGPGFKRLAIGVLVIGLAFFACLRAATWGDPLHLAMEHVALNPQSPRASSDLATLYVGMSDSNPDSPFYYFGKKEFERGATLPGASPLPEQGLILMAATTEQPVDDAWWASMIHKLRTNPISPQEGMAVTGLISERYRGIEMDDKRLSEAARALLDRGSQPAHVYAVIGDHALRFLQDEDLADRLFVSAIEHSGGDPDYAARVLANLIADGYDRQAQHVFEAGHAMGLFNDQTPH